MSRARVLAGPSGYRVYYGSVPDSEPTTGDEATDSHGIRSVDRVPLALGLAAPAAVVLLVLLAFIPALQADFVNWDDYELLFGNARYQTLHAENIRWMFTTSAAGHFQPLTWLSYALDYRLWGLNPFGYHLTNVVLHAIAAFLVYFVARRLLAASASSGKPRGSLPLILSASFAAVLFAVHPLRVESVAWVSERRDVLSGVLYLLSVASYLRYVGSDRRVGIGTEIGGEWSTSWMFYGLAVAACMLSLLAKASAITLPFVLCVLDIYPLGRLGGPNASDHRTNRRVWIEKIPFVLLAILAGVRALQAQAEGGGLYPLANHDWLARAAQACYGLTFYLCKTVWPTNLGPLYEIPSRDVLLGSMFWGSLLVVIGVASIAILYRRYWPALAAALSAYILVLTPVLGFAQSGPQLVADRYSYLSCIGFAVLGGALLRHCMRRESWWATPQHRPLLVLAVSVVVALCARGTFQQADIWRSPLTLWHRGVAVSPQSGVAQVCYADALAVAKNFPAAKTHYEKGLEIDPEDPVAWHHLADLYNTLGEREEAIRTYLHALRLDPNRSRACLSLAKLLTQAGRPAIALKILRDGAERRSDDAELIEYLAELRATHPDDQIRNGEEATEWAKRALQLRGREHIPALRALGDAQAETGRFDDAVKTMQRALILAQQRGEAAWINELNERLSLFRDAKPFRTQP